MSFFLSTHSTYCMQIVTPNNFLYYSYACPNYSTVVKYCNNDDSTTLVVKLFGDVGFWDGTTLNQLRVETTIRVLERQRWSLTRAIFIYLTRAEVNGNLFWRPKLHKGDYVFVLGDKDFGRFS